MTFDGGVGGGGGSGEDGSGGGGVVYKIVAPWGANQSVWLSLTMGSWTLRLELPRTSTLEGEVYANDWKVNLVVIGWLMFDAFAFKWYFRPLDICW